MKYAWIITLDKYYLFEYYSESLAVAVFQRQRAGDLTHEVSLQTHSRKIVRRNVRTLSMSPPKPIIAPSTSCLISVASASLLFRKFDTTGGRQSPTVSNSRQTIDNWTRTTAIACESERAPHISHTCTTQHAIHGSQRPVRCRLAKPSGSQTPFECTLLYFTLKNSSLQTNQWVKGSENN